MELNQPWWIDVIKAFFVVNLVLGAFAYLTWTERKVLGRMQNRYGPNRAGFRASRKTAVPVSRQPDVVCHKRAVSLPLVSSLRQKDDAFNVPSWLGSFRGNAAGMKETDQEPLSKFELHSPGPARRLPAKHTSETKDSSGW